MYNDIAAYTFLHSTIHGENGGKSLFVRDALIFLTFLDGVSSMPTWKKPHETGRKSRQRKRRTATAIRPVSIYQGSEYIQHNQPRRLADILFGYTQQGLTVWRSGGGFADSIINHLTTILSPIILVSPSR